MSQVMSRAIETAGRIPVLRGASYRLTRHLAVRRLRKEFDRFARLAADRPPRFELAWADRYPCLDDRTSATQFERDYVYHCAWAARILARLRPSVHVDIASSLHFVTLVSAFVPIRFYDYRPAPLSLSGLDCGRADLTALTFPDGSIPSLSCMHVVEHVGLGRYGDPLDPDGDLKAMRELRRVLAPGGSLLFVVPVGRPRVAFNAHRIYAYRQIVDTFAGLRLREFALIPDDARDGDLVAGAEEALVDRQTYGCGCFWFERDR